MQFGADVVKMELSHPLWLYLWLGEKEAGKKRSCAQHHAWQRSGSGAAPTHWSHCQPHCQPCGVGVVSASPAQAVRWGGRFPQPVCVDGVVQNLSTSRGAP